MTPAWCERCELDVFRLSVLSLFPVVKQSPLPNKNLQQQPVLTGSLCHHDLLMCHAPALTPVNSLACVAYLLVCLLALQLFSPFPGLLCPLARLTSLPSRPARSLPQDYFPSPNSSQPPSHHPFLLSFVCSLLSLFVVLLLVCLIPPCCTNILFGLFCHTFSL